MRRVGVVLANLRHAVMVPVEGVGDVGAVNIVDLDFEAVTQLSGVVEGIEIVQVTDDGGGTRAMGTEGHHGDGERQ